MKKYLISTTIFTLFTLQCHVLFAQCNVPSLSYSNGVPLCTGNSTVFTVAIIPPTGCKTADNNLNGMPVYKLFQNGVQLSTSNSNNFTTTLAGNATYTAQVLLEQNPVTPTIACPCIGYTGMSNAVVSNNIPAAPANLTQTVCSGSSPIITVNRGNATALPVGDLRWYTSGNVLVNVGQSYTVPNITSTTTFSVSEKVGECESPKNTVTLNPTAGYGLVAPSIATNPSSNAICNGATSILTASHGNASQTGVFTWYTSTNLTAPIHTGAVLTANPISTTTYVVNENQGGCISPSSSQMITVTPLTAPSVTALASSICPNNTATLTATTGGANGTFEWFSDASATNLLFTGNPFVTPNLTTNTTYYVREKLGNCVSSTASITIQTNIVPVVPSVVDPTICSNTTTTLMVTNGNLGDVFKWYDASTGGNLLAVTANYTPPILTASKQFYVERVNGNCVSSRKTVSITVNPTPPSPTASDVTICYNQIATLVASSSGSMNWYTSASAGTAVGTGGTYVTGNLTQNLTYYVDQVASNGCVSPRVPVVIHVSPKVQSPSVTSNVNMCFGATTTISTTSSGTNGNFIKWYDVGTGGTALQTNSVGANPTISFTTPNLFTDKTYYVAETNAQNTCESERRAIQVVVQAQLFAPTLATATALCQFIPTSIPATYNSTSPQVGNIVWYETNTSTSPLFIGKNYNLPSSIVNANGSYTLYAEHSLNNCVSPRSPMAITVNPKLAAPTTTPNITTCENGTINLTATVAGSASYSWTGPNGFSSNLQNPTIASAKETDHQGVYQVIATDNTTGCISNIGTTVVSVFPQPQSLTLTSNSPICENETLILKTNTINGATYTWKTSSGTVLGTTTTPTYSILNATPANSGEYSVDLTLSTCSPPTATTTAVVNPIPPAPTLSGSTSICAGQSIDVKSNTYQNANYNWMGSNGYTSSNQNLWIPNADVSNSAKYSLQVTINGCVSLPTVSIVTVNPLPVLPPGQAISSNSPVCEGQTITLIAPTLSDMNYQWTGVTNFSSSAQNPTIPNVNHSQHQGNYDLVLINPVTKCISLPYTLYVKVNQTLSQLSAINNGPVCEGDALDISASQVQDATYSWTGPNGFTSNLQRILIPNATQAHSGEYKVLVTTPIGCISSVNAVTYAQIIAKPGLSAGASQTVSQGDVVQLGASGALLYSWSPNTYLSDPSISNPKATLPVGTHTFYITGFNGNGCSNIDSVTIVVNSRTSLGDKDKGIMSFLTPNGDGKNDVWIVDYIQNLSNYELTIFDQKGLDLYSTNNYQNDWAGTYRNENLPDGTYYYLIKTDTQEFKGAIWLQRGN